MKALPYIVLAMVIYDLSIHLVYLLDKQNFFLDRHLNYWPEWRGKDQKAGRRHYQQFWSFYWSTAAVLLLIYLLNN